MTSFKRIIVTLTLIGAGFIIGCPLTDANAGATKAANLVDPGSQFSRSVKPRRRSIGSTRVRRLISSLLNRKPRHNHPRRVPKYHTVNNHTKELRNANWRAQSNRRVHVLKSVSGPKMKFRTIKFLPDHVGRTFLLQSVAVTPNHRTVFLGFDMSDDRAPNGRTKVARFDLRKKRFKISREFHGGHGQAMAYDPKTNRLWFLVTALHPTRKGFFLEVNPRTLRPGKRIRFRLRNRDDWYGDDLAFDRHGTAFNESRIRNWERNHKFKTGSIVIYRGHLGRNGHGKPLKRVDQGIKREPGQATQGLAYNPRNRRLYFETNGALQSIPVSKLGHLKPKDVTETIFRTHREFEGLAFDQRGTAYLALIRPSEIMKSNHVIK